MPYLKWALIALVAVAAIWGLYPRRPAPPAKDARVIEIGFMGPGGPVSGPLDDIVREFERQSLEAHKKDPSKPVYRVVSGQSAAFDQVADPTRFLISVAGGQPPDVIWFDRFAVAEWAARGAFSPLDGYIKRDLENKVPNAIQPREFYENVWAETVYKDRPYAIPNSVDDRVFFYNKDLLKAAGLVDKQTGEAKPPTTWEELREYNKILTRKNERGQLTRVGFVPNFGNSWLYMFAFMADAKFMSDDGRNCTLNEGRAIQALTYMVNVYNDTGGYSDVMAFQSGFQGGELDPFVMGKVAMLIQGASYINFLAQYAKDVDFGVAPNPRPEALVKGGAPQVSWSGGWSYAIPVNAQQKDAAWEFIRFATSDRGFRVWTEGMREAAEAMGQPFIPDFVPKVKLNEEVMQQYVFSNPQLSERVKQGVKTALDLLPFARFRPVTPVGQLLWNQHVTAMETACYGQKSPKDALDYARGVVQRDLDRFLTPSTGPLVKTRWFIISYLLLVVFVIYVVYSWDTRADFRRRVTQMLRVRKNVGEGDVVEGARGGYFRAQWFGGFMCALPWILGFIVFGGGPLLFSVVMSFCDYDVLNPARFIGLKNFHILFHEDELAPKAFLNTCFMLLGIPLGISLGLGLALLLNLRLKGMQLYRTLFYLPAVIPAIASMMLWIWIFNPIGGPLNALLQMFGFEGLNWLGDQKSAKPSIILMGLWGVGGGMVIWLAGLRNISQQLYEAAAIDGAGVWSQFRHITIPQLSPYIFFNLIMALIGGFQVFDEAFVMTRGGPVNSTTFYVYHLFNNAFRYGHMGYACAMAWVLFVIILVFTIIQMRFARRWVHYESE